MKRAKYLFVYTLPISVLIAFNNEGIMTFMPIILFFGVVPLVELLIKPDSSNLDIESAEKEKDNPFYNWIMFLALPIQITSLIYFFFIINETPIGSIEYIGRIVSMGLMCGVLGINIGHELGHRSNRSEQFIGEVLLLTSLNTHFLPYHNSGHHFEVATPNDSATAGKNQLLYTFWLSSHFGSYIKAWQIEFKRMKKNGKAPFSLNNKMLQYSIANIAVIAAIYFFFNLEVVIAFILAASIGIILLETVNYIEHYGLLRKINDSGRYERVQHNHSWNSDHPLGRLLLFNLSRHSDHHYKASTKYQLLRSMSKSPQMPTGYPGMMVFSLFQPLWFYVMNKKLDRINTNDYENNDL